jgi:hypothetical protein
MIDRYPEGRDLWKNIVSAPLEMVVSPEFLPPVPREDYFVSQREGGPDVPASSHGSSENHNFRVSLLWHKLLHIEGTSGTYSPRGELSMENDKIVIVINLFSDPETSCVLSE